MNQSPSPRCRKALSTADLCSRYRGTNVPFAKMPKGVEHRWSMNRTSDTMAVPFAKMPKGVEHFSSCRLTRRPGDVPFAKMPKGVEHVG